MGIYYHKRSHGLGKYLIATFLGLLLGWALACQPLAAQEMTPLQLSVAIKAKADSLYRRPSPTVTRRLALGVKALADLVALLEPALPAPLPPPPPVPIPSIVLSSISLTPALDTVQIGETVQFTTTGTWSDASTSVVIPAYSTSGGGSVSTGGLYTASLIPGTFKVFAAAGAKLDTSTVVIVSPPVLPPSPPGLPTLPQTLLTTTYSAPAGTVYHIAAGANLQTAINNAACGDRILLAAGAVYTGAFSLPNKSCSTYIEISTETTLPAAGTRVSLTSAANYATIRSAGSNLPALVAASGAGWYRIMGVKFDAASNVTSLGALVELHKDAMSNVNQLPHHIIFDRVVFEGHAALHVRRCLLLNAVSSAVIDSYLTGCHYLGADAQAILFWDTPGPLKIVNNFLEGSGENLMIGGADPQLTDVVPSDIEIRGNYFFKPAAWKTSGQWTIKNLLELKLGKRVLIEGNVFENTWAAGQAGYAIVVKSVNQSNTAPWSETSDVTIQKNIIQNAQHGIDISAHPEPYTVVKGNNIAVLNNLIWKLGTTSALGSGGGIGFLLDGATEGVFIRNNTVLGSTAHAVLLYGTKESQSSLQMQDNVFETWIKSADGFGWGTFALNGHLTTWAVDHNCFGIGYSNVIAEHPTNNTYSLTMGAIAFTSLSSGDVSLSASSVCKAVGTDSADPGVILSQVQAATLGSISGVWQ